MVGKELRPLPSLRLDPSFELSGLFTLVRQVSTLGDPSKAEIRGIPVLQSTFLPEPDPQDPTPSQQLLKILRDTIQQYSNRLSDSTKRDVSDLFERLQDICPTVEKVSSAAEESMKWYEERRESITKRYQQTANILQDILQNESTNVQTTNARLRTETTTQKTLLDELGREHAARIQGLSQTHNAAAERNIKELRDTIDQQIAASSRTFQAINSELETKNAMKDRDNLQLRVQLQTIKAVADSSKQSITDLEDRLQQSTQKNEDLEVEMSFLRRRLNEALHANTTLKSSLDESMQTIESLRTEMFTLREHSREPLITPSTRTAPKRPSIVALSPERISAKKTALDRPTRNHDKILMDDDAIQAEPPDDVPLISTASTSNTSRYRQQFTITTSSVIISYPFDTISVGCLRVDVNVVNEGNWAFDVSEIMKKEITKSLQWAKERRKSYAVPKNPPDPRCLWHIVARNSARRDCVWQMNEGVEDKYHACTDCEELGKLCFVLESENVFVLLPLLPSARREAHVGPRDLSYWVNDAS